MSINMIKRICVYCGSSPGRNPAYMSSARDLGESLADRKITLVYGGANIGLMDAVANATLGRDGEVMGVIPESIADKVGHMSLTKQYVVPSMHHRKQKMFDLSDAFVVLPGGYGTLEEMFELLTWAQLGMHTKPIGILNVAGYFDALLAFLDSTVKSRFISQVHRDMLVVSDDAAELLDQFNEYHPISAEKWLDRNLQ